MNLEYLTYYWLIAVDSGESLIGMCMMDYFYICGSEEKYPLSAFIIKEKIDEYRQPQTTEDH